MKHLRSAAMALAATLLGGAGTLPAEDLGSISSEPLEAEAAISLPPVADSKLESDEDPAHPVSIFADKNAREKSLGKTPVFVYIPSGPDPMIIPWVRDAIVAVEQLDKADRLLAQAQREGSAQLAADALRILEGIKPDDLGADALEKREALIRTSGEYPSTIVGVMPTRSNPLPEWIRQNTVGIVLDRAKPEDSIALIGDSVVRAGDSIDRFPAVKVRQIQPQRVIFEYNDAEFSVPVQPYS